MIHLHMISRNLIHGPEVPYIWGMSLIVEVCKRGDSSFPKESVP